MNSEEFLNHPFHNQLKEIVGKLDDENIKNQDLYSDFKYIVEYINNYVNLIDDKVLPNAINNQQIADVLNNINSYLTNSNVNISNLTAGMDYLRHALSWLNYFPIKTTKNYHNNY
jgi:hypothetical protein